MAAVPEQMPGDVVENKEASTTTEEAAAESSETPADERAQKLVELNKVFESFKAKLGDVPEISIKELKQLLQDSEKKVILVDARAPEEQAVSIIPGAVKKKDFVPDPNQHDGAIIVPYCTLGYRSGMSCLDYRAKGLDIKNLRGGILAWILEGGEVQAEGSAEPVKKVHTFAERFLTLVPGDYEGVAFAKNKTPLLSLLWEYGRWMLPFWR